MVTVRVVQLTTKNNKVHVWSKSYLIIKFIAKMS